MSGCHGLKDSSSKCQKILQNGRNGLLRQCAAKGNCSRSGGMLWKSVMAHKRQVFSTPRLLKSRNTAASPAMKRFANSFRFSRGGDSPPLLRETAVCKADAEASGEKV